MGFVASEVVESLTFDFTPYGPTGTIEEPSTQQIEDYRTALIEVYREAQSLDTDPAEPPSMDAAAYAPPTKEQILARLDLVLDPTTVKKNKELEAKILAATAQVTGLDPAVLAGLPFRFQSAFQGWITGLFFNPEA